MLPPFQGYFGNNSWQVAIPNPTVLPTVARLGRRVFIVIRLARLLSA